MFVTSGNASPVPVPAPCIISPSPSDRRERDVSFEDISWEVEVLKVRSKGRKLRCD